MRRLTFVLFLAVLTLPALAQTTAPAQTAAPAQTSQRDKMRACNDQAKTQKLKGDERKTFIASCLSGTPAAAPGTAAPAAGSATRMTSPTTTAPKPAPAPTTATRPAPPSASKAAPSTSGSAVFPTAVSPKYSSESAGKARMHTCLDQYNANKATNANAGLNWIAKGGGYYAECNKRLKG